MRDGKAEAFRTPEWQSRANSLQIVVISIQQAHVDEILDHAREEAPRECCGLIGGINARTQTVYQLRNVAADPLTTYEASPEDLISAQRSMRDHCAQLLAICHSH